MYEWSEFFQRTIFFPCLLGYREIFLANQYFELINEGRGYHRMYSRHRSWDALGLPYEGLSFKRATRLFPKRGSYHLILGRGMVSDDTEHTCFVAEALLSAKGNPDRFEKHLARSFRHWLLALPPGVGLATLKSIIRLWLGFPPARSGVFSAGNGPSMRSALLGVVYGNRPDVLREFVMRVTRLTHSDPKA